jgi:hypothetical protein
VRKSRKETVLDTTIAAIMKCKPKEDMEALIRFKSCVLDGKGTMVVSKKEISESSIAIFCTAFLCLYNVCCLDMKAGLHHIQSLRVPFGRRHAQS